MKPAKWHQEWRKRNPRSCEISRIKYKFKVSKEEAERLLDKATNGSCDVCGKKHTRPKLNIDHNHKTGIIRGVLCHSCNVVLGLVKDKPELLGKLQEYLYAI